jgi:hypothetical protein
MNVRIDIDWNSLKRQVDEVPFYSFPDVAFPTVLLVSFSLHLPHVLYSNISKSIREFDTLAMISWIFSS